LLGPLMLGTGYLGGKLSLLHTVRMLATAPARRFGLGSSKGALAVGLDADLVAYDPSARTRITAADSHSSAGWSPYEGYEIPGRITATFVRGTRVCSNGAIVAGLGHGRFVRPSVLSAVSA
jgi:allantoinase